MRNQPTLAEILADDAGNIRAEIADMLMEPQAQRLPGVHRVRRHRRSLLRSWLIVGFTILFIGIAIYDLMDLAPPRSEPKATEKTNEGHSSATSPAKDLNAVEPVMSLNTGKTGRVIGDSVFIRTQPNLQGEIIKIVNEDEILNVISFDGRWYHIALSNQQSGYIFGAYLLPQDFDSAPYLVAVLNKDQSKLLVRDCGHPLHFHAIWPNGQITWILKEDVAIYK